MGNKIAKFASPRSQNDRCSISLKRKRSTDIDFSDEEQEMHTAKRYKFISHKFIDAPIEGSQGAYTYTI
jgi:hypothetical protein